MDEPLPGIIAEMGALRRYARALVRDSEAADDLVQDCMVRALSRLHLWRRDGNLRAWLFTILRNIHLNQRRYLSRHPTPLPLLEGDEPASGAQQLARVEIAEVMAAFAELPEEQREALFLSVVEGLRYHEIAELLGISMGTVMSRLARGRERLRQLVDEPTATPRLRRVK